MGIPGEVPRNHKDSMPVVKERTYIHPQKYRDGYGKITNYSSLPSVKELREKLEPHEQALFRTTAIGHLLDIPIKQRWSGAIFHYLLSREVGYHADPGEKSEEDTKEKVEETWFSGLRDKQFGFGKGSSKKRGSKTICDNPCDKDICFGKLEFALISGLSFRKPDQTFVCPPDHLPLRQSIFPPLTP
ncbi:hypothetical protein MKW92_050122 [Papaver armeniacum]|nr:hypothetical protein MKW92_050122 [Papaver armeniacum]